MRLLARLRRRRPYFIWDDYLTPAQHRQEAERLSWVIDDVLQSEAQRSLSDLIAIARLHLDLANASESSSAPVTSAAS